jgi:hypothetical protein
MKVFRLATFDQTGNGCGFLDAAKARQLRGIWNGQFRLSEINVKNSVARISAGCGSRARNEGNFVHVVAMMEAMSSFRG